ncbi:GerW family sporulation protein [Tuberibacillus sp. Marseille-P3662]|uniref:GerW family sporulation protein n=1 Tax=Tuberibacillus sp. Marseille-P3662 TaxID=1965358 RepID=UPI000A1CAA4E|nr:GerW family sporulation protein [Tuberibacillus sp. Marseille-P3662]
MSEHPIQGLMKTALESLQEMTDVNTIIGDPIETPDGNVILTVSKVGFGFAAGGSEFQMKQSSGQGGSSDSSDSSDSSESNGSQGNSSLPFGGGSGGGVSITPIAFLIVGPQGVRTIHLDNSTHIYEKLLNIAPQAVEKIQEMLQKQSKQQNGEKSGQQESEGKSSGRGVVRHRNQEDDES